MSFMLYLCVSQLQHERFTGVNPAKSQVEFAARIIAGSDLAVGIEPARTLEPDH
jgi:hypothetical protein